MPPHLRGIEREGEADPSGVSVEAAPVTLVSEGFSLKNSHRREQSPTAQQTSLARRKTYLLDLKKTVVVEHIAVDHLNLMRGFPAICPDILTQVCPGRIVHRDLRDVGSKTTEREPRKVSQPKRGLP